MESNSEREVYGAWDIISTQGLDTTESRPEPHWQSLGCAWEDFAQWSLSLIIYTRFWPKINATLDCAIIKAVQQSISVWPFFFSLTLNNYPCTDMVCLRCTFLWLENISQLVERSLSHLPTKQPQPVETWAALEVQGSTEAPRIKIVI